jgi:putative transcriptional regulator
MRTRVKEYRDQKKMTQQELADKVGVRRETIVFLEQGKYSPSLNLAHEVAKVFGVKIEKLFIF